MVAAGGWLCCWRGRGGVGGVAAAAAAAVAGKQPTIKSTDRIACVVAAGSQ